MSNDHKVPGLDWFLSGMGTSDAEPPTIVVADQVGEELVAFSYTPTITDLPAGGSYTVTLFAGTLPAGLSLNATTGEISGTPTTAVIESGIRLRVVDAAGNAVVSDAFSVTINVSTPEFLDLFDDWGVVTPTKTNLYTHHLMDGDATDEQTTAHGTVEGDDGGFASTLSPPGGVTQSFFGDPTEVQPTPEIDYVQTGTTAWNFNNQDFTAVALFYRSGTENNFVLAGKMNSTGIGAGWIFRVDNAGDLHSTFGDGVDGAGGDWDVSWRFHGAGTIATQNQWQMAAITWDTSEGRMRGYWGDDSSNRIEQRSRMDDGVAMQNADMSNSAWGTMGAINTASTAGSNEFWGVGPNSSIGQVLVFDRKLTAGEIEWLYDKLITKDEAF